MEKKRGYIFSKFKNISFKHRLILILQPNESNKQESINKLIYCFKELKELLHFLNENHENVF